MVLLVSSWWFPARQKPCVVIPEGAEVASVQFTRTTEVPTVHNFVQFSGSVSTFVSDLQAAFSGSVGFIQGQADTTVGRTSNALIVVNNQKVFSVPPNNYLGYTGSWEQYSPTQMAGAVFTPVTASGGTSVSYIPSYAGTRTKSFDPARSIYNQIGTNMQLWRTWLGRARSGSQMVRVGFLGDSLTAGFLSNIGAEDPVSQLRALLKDAGYTVGELVWLVNSGSNGLTDSRVNLGGWSYQGVPYANSVTAGGQLTYTSIAAGTVVEILSTGQSGSFTYTIDGGSPVTINPNVTQMVLTRVTGLPNTTHTVVLTASASRAYVAAIGVNNAKGICLMNASQCGSSAALWLGTNAYSDLINVLISAQPNVVLAELGSNDQAQGVAVATFQTSMQSLITKLKTANATPFLTATMQYPGNAYWNALYNLADNNNLPLLDLQDLMATVPSDLKESDGQHLNGAGYAIKTAGWADMLQIPRTNAP